MDEKLSIHNLITFLMEQHSMSQTDAEQFVIAFFELIKEELQNEGAVKIKGLGTFKKVAVESRDSVSVNTGERILIEAYNKLVFTPESAVRDAVNKPFAHFEPVVLKNSTTFDDMTESEIEEMAADYMEEDGYSLYDDDASETESSVDEAAPATGETGVTTEATVPEKDTKVTEPSTPIETVEKETPEEEAKVAESEADKSQVDESEVAESESTPLQAKNSTSEEETIQKTTAKEETDQEATPEEEAIQKATSKEEVIQEETSKATEQSAAEEQSAKKGNWMLPLFILVLVILALCAGFIGYMYSDLFYNDACEAIEPPTIQLVQEETPLPSDSLVLITDASEMKEEVSQNPAQAQEVKKEETPQEDRTSVAEKAAQPAPQKKVEKTSATPKKAERPAAIQPEYPENAQYKIVGTKEIYTLKSGNTLMKLSLKYYGTKAMWRYIVEHNRDVITDPDNVPIGTKLKIPELQQK